MRMMAAKLKRSPMIPEPTPLVQDRFMSAFPAFLAASARFLLLHVSRQDARRRIGVAVVVLPSPRFRLLLSLPC